MTVTINGSGTITGVSAGGLPDGSVTDSTLALTANSQEVKDALNASGSAPIYACRAWVNFNGTGTVAIRASGNVSSIIDNGTGYYTVNFSSAMPDANYSVGGSAYGNVVHLIMSPHITMSTTQCGVITSNTTAVGDNSIVSVQIFR